MDSTVDKTSIISKELEQLYDALNNNFFDGELETPIITICPSVSKAPNQLTSSYNWIIDDVNVKKELRVPSIYLTRGALVLSTYLLHEQTHLYCQNHQIKDTSNNGRYHNKRFKEAAESHGLECKYNKRGAYGVGFETFPSKELVEFLKLYEMKKTNIDIVNTKENFERWSRYKAKESHHRKYQCPKCGNSVRATKELGITCNECGVPMKVTAGRYKKGNSYKWICYQCGTTVRSTKPIVNIICGNCMKQMEYEE